MRFHMDITEVFDICFLFLFSQDINITFLYETPYSLLCLDVILLNNETVGKVMKCTLNEKVCD